MEKVDFVPTKDWQPIPRISRTIPFGYELDPDNSKRLLPNVFQLEVLEKAKFYVKRFSYREVAEWVSNITGRKISFMGLKKRLEKDDVRRRRATTLTNWAERYRKAAEEASKIEEERLGAHKASE